MLVKAIKEMNVMKIRVRGLGDRIAIGICTVFGERESPYMLL